MDKLLLNNMDGKERYLNDLMNRSSYSGPKYLYKYRSFDEHTFEMLENDYVWLSKASSLDDPTECKVTINEENYFDFINDNLRREVVDQLLEFLSNYSSKETKERCKELIYRHMTCDNRFSKNFVLNASAEIKELEPNVSDEIISNFVDLMETINKMFDRPEIKQQIEEILLVGLEAREKIGICSLADSPNNEELWINYANDGTGYCIEYEMKGYEYNNFLFPVDYVEERQTNIIVQLVKSFLGQMITKLSNNQLNVDKSLYLSLFITKDMKWNYQNEWRLIGDANQKVTSPKIKKIIVGSKVSKQNYDYLSDFCVSHNIELQKRQI